MALYKLRNTYLEVAVEDLGAELQSLHDRIKGREYIWQGDPKFWQRRAPHLFPIIGGGLKDGAYQHDGKQYSLPKVCGL